MIVSVLDGMVNSINLYCVRLWSMTFGLSRLLQHSSPVIL